MKHFLIPVITCFVFIACNNSADEPIAEYDNLNREESYLWQSSMNDSSGKLEMKKIPSNDSLSAQSVINFLNTDNPNVKLELVKTSNDTIFLKIAESTYLTQQMGSSGPELYLAEVVYNLTELAGVKQVSLDFEEGDHATPGTFNRDSFKDE
ncbi:MAG: hypothetical protein SGI83_08650 [Bacteroidota bacterium]|nr:hypothetical protein [Bacteroidota bacterium]